MSTVFTNFNRKIHCCYKIIENFQVSPHFCWALREPKSLFKKLSLPLRN